MTMNDPMPETGETPAETPETPDTAEEAPPAIDMDAVEKATNDHSAAVQTAHVNLATRMASAYAEFTTDLDRAYSAWDNAVSDAKRVAQLFSPSEVEDHGSTDPTRVR
jgi:hypothetical protein